MKFKAIKVNIQHPYLITNILIRNMTVLSKDAENKYFVTYCASRKHA